MIKVAAVLLFLLFSFSPASFSQSLSSHASNETDISVKVFFEAMDSQGWQLFFLADALKRRLPGIKLDVYPLVHKGAKGEWVTPRGEIELKESARMMRVRNKYPAKLSTYLVGRSLCPWPEGWFDSAVYADINPLELSNAVDQKKNNLLEQSFAEAEKNKVSKPVILLNGKLYNGELRLLSLMEAVNEMLPAGKKINLYKEQRAMIKPPAFKVITTAASKKFADENTTNIFKRYFINLKPENLNYASIEVKRMFPGLRFLPAYVIEDTPSVRENFAQAIAAGVMEKLGKYYVYYNRSGKLLINGRKEQPKKLELFVMSQCPYGVIAENSIIDAVNKSLISRDIDIKVHYIADASRDEKGTLSFKSLHGDPEWKENARQLIIAKNYPDKFFSYLSERNKNYRSAEWTEAAIRVGLNPEKIESEEEKGKRLLEEDVKKANSLGINSSPTFLVNGNILVVGVKELVQLEDYKKLNLQQSGGAACSQ